jgi:arsenical pump membrane protein
VGGAALVVSVTAVLNLDTSVVFLTPVLVHAARSRGQDERPLLYGCLLLLAPTWAAAVVVTATVIGLMERRSLRSVAVPAEPPPVPTYGVGLLAVVAVSVLVVVLRAPALPVAAVGVVVTGIRVVRRRLTGAAARRVLGLPVLVALFGAAVALGTLGRWWSGPATWLGHLDGWGTAAAAAASSVLVNNLPAASLLASRVPPHPYALLVGLDIGPNLFVTGSLAWILWRRAARAVGAEPSLARARLLGGLSVPLSMAAAVAVLTLTGSH